MKTEIFYLEHQKGRIEALKNTLRQHIYPALAITEYQIEWAREQDASRAGWRYVKLLQASIPPEKGINLNIHELGVFGYRFYIEVYYAFRYFARRAFQTDRLSEFFPAVAIGDRMVLIPRGLGEKLKGDDQGLSPFNPVEMGGVIETDFDDPAELTQAADQVAGILRADLLRELRAYASYQKAADFDLARIARDLEMDAGFILHALKAEATELDFYDQLHCELDLHRVSPDSWTKVHLSVRNDSDMDLADLSIDVSGPAAIRPSRLAISVPARSTQTLPIAIKPDGRGEFPIEVTFTLPDDRVFANLLPVHHIWLQSE